MKFLCELGGNKVGGKPQNYMYVSAGMSEDAQVWELGYVRNVFRSR